MQSEDQYMERTPDLVTKIRKLREAADKEMNRFTSLSHYDVRHVVGHGRRTAQVSPSAAERRLKRFARNASTQTSIKFPPISAESDSDRETE
jgi:hypothetical protein